MRGLTKSKQRGATFLGMVTILAILGLALYAGIRLVPKYTEYYSAVSIMERVANNLKGGTPSIADVKKDLETKWSTDYIYEIQPKDIDIKKSPNGGLEMHLEYQAMAPFIGNVSLAVDFDKVVVIPGGGREL